ncbi:MAG TPA: hypothetical protein VEL76_25735 [Gemmataceae bacterium]|nr:hypothetical protein [Gemmataceae bacterium]
MEELWLVCEGGPGSVDAAVLKPIFTHVLVAGITVVSAGGSSPGVAAAFLQSHRGGKAAYVVDRDYRRWEQAEASFHDGTNGFMWRRHSIENYLLPATVIVRAFQRLRQRAEHQFAGHLPAWAIALPTDPEQVTDALRGCARRRAPEEACRLAIQSLWEDLSETAGRVQRRVPPLPPGSEGQELVGWREALCQETQRLRDAVAQTMGSPHLEGTAIVRRFDEIYTRVTANEYIANLQFLSDFHGRDLLGEFRRWLGHIGVHLKYEKLVGELIDAAGEVYAATRAVYTPDDFLDLANGVRALAGLPPLS